MKLSIRVDTTEFRGDHSAEVCRIFDPLEDETVAQLVVRVINLTKNEYHDPYLDVIRIQLVEERT